MRILRTSVIGFVPTIIAAIACFSLVQSIIFRLCSLFLAALSILVLFYVPPPKVSSINGHHKLKYFAIRADLVFPMILVLASLVVVLTPPPLVVIDSQLILSTFVSLTFPSAIRMLCGYFLVSIAPGYIIHSNLLAKIKEPFERVCLTLLLSYAYSVVLGEIILKTLKLTDPNLFVFYYILSIWVMLLLLSTARFYYERRRLESDLISSNEEVSSRARPTLTWLLIGSYVLLSYVQTLLAGPLSGLVGSDVGLYAAYANRFMYYGMDREVVYIWSHVYIFVTSFVTGLPMHYSYAGLQFLQILIPLSFCVLVRKLFKSNPKRDEICLIALLLMLYLNGITALTLIVNSDMLSSYLAGNSDTLWTLFLKVGSPGYTPYILSALTFEIATLLLAFSYTYEYLFDSKPNPSKLVLSGFLASIAVYSHSFVSSLVFIVVLFLMFLYRSDQRKRVVFVFLSFASFLLVFDPLFENYVTNYGMNFIMGHATLQDYTILISLSVLSVALLVFLSLFGKRILHAAHITSRVRSLRDKRTVKHIFLITGAMILASSVILYFANMESIIHAAHWSNLSIVFPWFFILYKYYGVVVLLAVAAIPYLIRLPRDSAMFLVSLMGSALIIALLSLMLPTVLFPALVYYRYTGFILYPLSILGAVLIVRNRPRRLRMIGRLSSRNRRKILAITTLILFGLVPVQILSQSYAREVWYIQGQHPAMSNQLSASLEWANTHIPKGATILPVSQESEIMLSSTVSYVKVVPISSEAFEYLKPIFNGTLSSLLTSLRAIGVDYIFLGKTDFDTLISSDYVTLFLLLVSLVPLYQNSEARIYALP